MVAHAFGMLRQAVCEFESSLVYTMNSRTARDAQRDPVSKKRKIGKDYPKVKGSFHLCRLIPFSPF